MNTITINVGLFSFCCQIILLLFVKFQREYADAELYHCDNNTFGYECRFQCRCQHHEYCNVTNGFCHTGCADGYWGSNCQLSNECYYNGHPENYEGTLSVAGRNNRTCKNWSNKQHNYCRTNGYTYTFCLLVGGDWAKCRTVNCNCPSGLYGESCTKECHCKNATEVCGARSGYCRSGCGRGWKSYYCDEECDFGTFGRGCHHKCHCADNFKCRKTDGECLDGLCAAGYTGSGCQTECDIGTFGRGCRQKCHCADNSKCRKTDGECLDGVCALGYTGSGCQTECDIGTFGRGCHYKCHCADNSKCRKTDGECLDGVCALGYTGSRCQTADAELYHCDNNTFGYECRFQCRCQHHEYCNVTNGFCHIGCADGYWGSNCQLSNECYYNGHPENYEGTLSVAGRNNRTCKNWYNKQHNYCRTNGYRDIYCYVVDGSLELCRTVNCNCPSGLYGENCNKECHCENATEVCDASSGYCTSGCGRGWKSKYCDEECDFGTFGRGCHHKCHCADNSKCRKTDGECLDGVCALGYTGSGCQTECDIGTFGRGCHYKCHCADNSKCRKTDGECLDGVCALGYTGSGCQTVNLALIVSLPLILILIIGIITGIIVYVKKRKSKKIIESEESKSGGDISMSRIDELNLIHDESEPEDVYQNTAYLVKCNILSYIEKSQMEEEPFATEFSRLPQGLIYTHDAGSLEENAKKNRYKTILPYDYSRVVLLPDQMSTSDYINASYITKEKKYIATQGPTSETFNDFWRMIWQQKCTKIIMLTDTIENGKLKCAQYWPELNHTDTYGMFKIHCVQEKKFMMHTYRLLSITKSSKWAEEESFIDHYQCTTWPDHGVPEDPLYLIEFRNKVRYRRAKPPYVVHCSAGIGRTGTYIALDILLKRMRQNLTLDVFQCVQTLRGQRPLMVHRKCQYQFIYEVLAEDTLTGFSEIQTDCIPSEFRRMLNKETDTKSLLQEHYENLLLPLNQPSKSPHIRKEAIYENIGLITDEDNNEDDFLTTLYLDGFHMMNEIILATQPNENIAEDFWKLIYQQNCTAIVMFEELFNAVAAYWPDEKNCPADYGSITVELMSLTETEAFFLRLFKVSNSQCATLDAIFVNHVQSKIWLNTPPPSHTEIIEFIQTVCGYIKPQKRILVHCQDGFAKSGLFSILHVMLHMLKTDPYVSILRLVRRMKKKNVDIDVDLRSYEYCWMVANVFLGDFSIYSNP